MFGESSRLEPDPTSLSFLADRGSKTKDAQIKRLGQSLELNAGRTKTVLTRVASQHMVMCRQCGSCAPSAHASTGAFALSVRGGSASGPASFSRACRLTQVSSAVEAEAGSFGQDQERGQRRVRKHPATFTGYSRPWFCLVARRQALDVRQVLKLTKAS